MPPYQEEREKLRACIAALGKGQGTMNKISNCLSRGRLYRVKKLKIANISEQFEKTRFSA
jgi:hypothetical protein